jgi:hypothetical protein
VEQVGFPYRLLAIGYWLCAQRNLCNFSPKNFGAVD